MTIKLLIIILYIDINNKFILKYENMWLDWLNSIESVDKIMTNEDILKHVIDKSNWFWTVKFVQASGHGGQHKDHGHSKAQLIFDVKKFFEEFDSENKKWEKFVEVFGKKNIHHNGNSVMLENQTERSAQRNKDNVLHKLKWLLSDVLDEEKERKQTKVPHHEKKKRMNNKNHNSKKKENRKIPEIE